MLLQSTSSIQCSCRTPAVKNRYTSAVGNDGKAIQVLKKLLSDRYLPRSQPPSIHLQNMAEAQFIPIHYDSLCPSMQASDHIQSMPIPSYAPKMSLCAAGSLGICTFHWATLLLEAGKKKKKLSGLRLKGEGI